MFMLETFLTIKVPSFFQNKTKQNKNKNSQILEEVAALQNENNNLENLFPYAMLYILPNFGNRQAW